MYVCVCLSTHAHWSANQHLLFSVTLQLEPRLGALTAPSCLCPQPGADLSVGLDVRRPSSLTAQNELINRCNVNVIQHSNSSSHVEFVI